MNDDDALGFAVTDVAELNDLLLKTISPLICAVGVHTGQHLHEGGLASTVLAADGVISPRATSSVSLGVSGRMMLNAYTVDAGSIYSEKMHVPSRKSQKNLENMAKLALILIHGILAGCF